MRLTYAIIFILVIQPENYKGVSDVSFISGIQEYFSKDPMPSIQEIDEKAKLCAQREWEKLKSKFFYIRKRNPAAMIFVGIFNDSFVWKEENWLSVWHLRRFNKVQYEKQTLEWLCKLAKEDGFIVLERDSKRISWKNAAEPYGLYWKYQIISNGRN